jgi:hypothetical protein
MKVIEESADEISRNKRSEKTQKAGSWLKVCQIDGDTNRNLASAFSVQRSKLPATFFIFCGTIVDRVSGTLTRDRIDSIFSKFLDYYAENTGVDFSKLDDGASNVMCAPTKRVLSDAVSALYRVDRLVASLVGPDRIRLPEEAEKIDGLKKEVQDAKKAAFDDLYRLHQKHGLDVRKLSDEELDVLLFGTETFYAAAAVSGLEALLLARCYALDASKSNVLRQAVLDAKVSVERDYLKRQLKGDVVRQAVALTSICVVRGDAQRQLSASVSEMTSEETAAAQQAVQQLTESSAPPLGRDPISTFVFHSVLVKVSEDLDHRLATSPPFPAAAAEMLVGVLKKLLPNARRTESDAEKFAMIKALLLALLQLYPRDAASVALRSRLSSILY